MYKSDTSLNIPAIDALRALAISLVIIAHSWIIINKEIQLTIIDKLYFLIVDFGVSGVDLFFVISGFLITRILLNNKRKPKKYSNFYIRRIFRIWPPYILFLTILFIVINWNLASKYYLEINFLNSNKWGFGFIWQIF